MKKVSSNIILGVMSLIIGFQFLRFDNGYILETASYEIVPGHLLIALGGVILIYYTIPIIHGVFIDKKQK